MGVRSFHFRMNDADPLDKEIIDWLVRDPNRSACIREALRVYFFLRKHGIPVAPAPPAPATPPAQAERAEPATQPEDPAASEFYQAMRAGLEEFI